MGIHNVQTYAIINLNYGSKNVESMAQNFNNNIIKILTPLFRLDSVSYTSTYLHIFIYMRQIEMLQVSPKVEGGM